MTVVFVGNAIGEVDVVLMYSIVAMPPGVIIFFKTSIGVKALWMGHAIGVSCVGFPPLYLPFYHIKKKWNTSTSLNEEFHDLKATNDRLSTWTPLSYRICSTRSFTIAN
ncbi:unnamed protein product [Phytomonas sp. Hart1]|nr:unnamed protein product [Phytomonas sp. Hart1]|eukprot:CCW68880.1 unnamed protein product [Phytomonas sp. isolate Hart1]